MRFNFSLFQNDRQLFEVSSIFKINISIFNTTVTIVCFSNRIYLNRKLTKLFIQLYKEHECLYDPSHDDYHNRIEKKRCLQNILQEIQKFVPELQLENVRSKIKTIRTQFAHELSLIESMDVAAIPYTPRLWCFKYLTFLRKFMSRLPNKEVSSPVAGVTYLKKCIFGVDLK